MSNKQHDEENLANALMGSVGKSPLSEIASEVSDIALDLVLDDGIIKEIPVFGWLMKGYQTYHNITERLFLKKVALFLYGVSEASEEARKEYLTKLDNEPKFRKRVGENILLLIDKHERLEKSKILGKIMAQVIEGNCSHEDFLRIAAALDRSTIEDLEYLAKHSVNIKLIPKSIKQSLYKSNLLDIEYAGYSYSGEFVDVDTDFKINSIGKKLIKFGF